MKYEWGSGVYLITNRTNGKVYVGSAVCLESRRQDHFCSPSQSSPILQNAMAKYGKENFKWEILEVVGYKKDLVSVEQYYLDWFQSFDREFGYNVAPKAGNTLGFKFSPESRRKMSVAKKGKPRPTDHLHTPEAKAKRKRAVELKRLIKTGSIVPIHARRSEFPHGLGKPKSEAHREKIRQAHLGRKRPMEVRQKLVEAWKTRPPCTLATRQKLSLANRGENSPSARLTLVDVSLIRSLHASGGFTFPQLGKRFGVSKTQIRRIVSGKSWGNYINLEENKNAA